MIVGVVSSRKTNQGSDSISVIEFISRGFKNQEFLEVVWKLGTLSHERVRPNPFLTAFLLMPNPSESISCRLTVAHRWKKIKIQIT